MLSPSRKYDSMLLLCQNDARQEVVIEGINDHAQEMLGYGVEELQGKPLSKVVTAKVADAIADYLDFEEGSTDLEDVVKKIRHFRFLSARGEEIEAEVKVVRAEAKDEHSWFQLLIEDSRAKEQENSFRRMVQDNLAGMQVIDEETGLPDAYSADQYIKLVNNYVGSQRMQACFAVLRIDRHPKNLGQYGKAPCVQLLKHVASFCERNLRSDDVTCRLDDNKLALILFDISQEPARVVLNRLRWFVSAHRIPFGGKSDFSMTVSIVFDELNGDSERDWLKEGTDILDSLDTEKRNVFIELGS